MLRDSISCATYLHTMVQKELIDIFLQDKNMDGRNWSTQQFTWSHSCALQEKVRFVDSGLDIKSKNIFNS